MKRYTTLLALVATGLAAQTALADEAPSGSSIGIAGLRYVGNGCPAGSVGSTISGDAKEIALMFSNFTSESRSNANRFDQRSCRIELDLSVPAGWSFGLFYADYRGFASLEGSSMGIQRATYSIAGSPTSAQFTQQTLVAPFQGEYTSRNMISLDKIAWSPCSSGIATLVIDTAISTQAGQIDPRQVSTAMMALDSIDASTRSLQTYAIKWKRCDVTPPTPPRPPVPPAPQPPAPPPGPSPAWQRAQAVSARIADRARSAWLSGKSERASRAKDRAVDALRDLKGEAEKLERASRIPNNPGFRAQRERTQDAAFNARNASNAAGFSGSIRNEIERLLGDIAELKRIL